MRVPAGWGRVDSYVVAERVLDGLAQVVLVGVRRPGEVVADNVGIERPVGMRVRFTEIDVEFRLLSVGYDGKHKTNKRLATKIALAKRV